MSRAAAQNILDGPCLWRPDESLLRKAITTGDWTPVEEWLLARMDTSHSFDRTLSVARVWLRWGPASKAARDSQLERCLVDWIMDQGQLIR